VTSDDQLRRVLQLHADDAPDATVVHADILATLTRKRRQRHAAQAAGAALVIGGLVAVPLVANSRADHTQRVAPVLGLPSQAPAPTSQVPTMLPTEANEALADLDVAAFFNAGYAYDDAVELAKLWNVPDPFLTKQLAGQQLSDGKELPIAPNQTIAISPGAVSKTDQELHAFTAKGYGVSDAKQLAAMWHEDDLTLVKQLAGQQLLDGVQLDVP
jgi:hypothetical protein